MKQDYQTLKIALQESGILQINLNRPDKLNALSDQLFDEMADVLADANVDEKVKGVLVTGEGKAFCAGADIMQIAALNMLQGKEFAKKGQRVFDALEGLGKPSIAAINGHAFGGGCELALAASIRIASSKAQFGQPEIKLGVIPGYGGTQRLSRLIGKGRALELCLTGRFIKAEQAEAWGLITEITEPKALLARANEILIGILAMAPHAITSTLEVVNSGYDMTLADGLALEAAHFGLLCGTQDKQEGAKAFLEKRQANFTGE